MDIELELEEREVQGGQADQQLPVDQGPLVALCYLVAQGDQEGRPVLRGQPVHLEGREDQRGLEVLVDQEDPLVRLDPGDLVVLQRRRDQGGLVVVEAAEEAWVEEEEVKVDNKIVHMQGRNCLGSLIHIHQGFFYWQVFLKSQTESSLITGQLHLLMKLLVELTYDLLLNPAIQQARFFICYQSIENDAND